MLDWKVGDKVVMVEGEDKLRAWSQFNEKMPQLNQVYTIREILLHSMTNNLCLRVNEIINPPQAYLHEFTECYWPTAFFRKVQEGGKGFELLIGLLDPQNHNKYTKRDEQDKKVKNPARTT